MRIHPLNATSVAALVITLHSLFVVVTATSVSYFSKLLYYL